ncbi:MAG: T9SS type A sorting domain-containing protein [Candidatus Eisenbacteria bacterium]
MTAIAYRGLESGSDASGTFSVYSVRRWTGITTSDLPDVSDRYTVFQATSNGPGAGFHHSIRDFGLVRSIAVTDARICVPVLPATNTISNVSVTGNGVSNVSVQGNVIAFDCNLTSGNVTRVNIEFDAASDLAATRIDRYQTGDIGLRDFRNGYLVWNRYIHTAIMGSGFSAPHGPACIVDLHVVDQVTGDPHTVDCMERVAVHLDDHADNDGTGTYQSNIKWGGDALDWYQSGDLLSLRFAFTSGGNYGLQDEVLVDRAVEFFAGTRYFRHHYRIENIDAASHDFDFVWGREQWLYGSAAGSDRDNRDRGILPTDPASYGGEHRFTPDQIDGNWFAAFDEGSFYSIAVLLPGETEAAMPTYAYFLCNAPLGNFTGEYPILPAGVCTDMGNLFFEKQLGILAPGEHSEYEFYQWGGYGQNRGELTQLLDTDAAAVAPDPAAAGGESSDDEPGLAIRTLAPNPFTSSIEIDFRLARAAMVSLAVFDIQGRQVAKLVEAPLAAGPHRAVWAGRDARDRSVPDGVYLVRLHADGAQAVRKVVVRR